MLNKVGWTSIAFLVAACSGGGSSDAPDPQTPGSPPPSGSTNSAPSVTTTQINATVDVELNATIAVTDVDGDSVTLTMLSGPTWLDVSSTGTLSGMPSLADRGADSLVIEASDGALTTTATIAIDVGFDAVEAALATGDHTLITEESDLDIETVLLNMIDPTLNQHRTDIETLYQLGSEGTIEETSLIPSWSPPSLNLVPDRHQQAVALTSTPGENTPGIRLRDGRTFGVIGRHESGARYLVLGGNPTLAPRAEKDFSDSNDMDLLLRNALNWLARDSDDGTLEIAITNAPKPESNGPDAEIGIRRWLDGAFGDSVSYNSLDTCQTEISACLFDTTDVIIAFRRSYSSETQINGRNDSYIAMTEAHKNGVGILYVYNAAIQSTFEDTMLKRFHVSVGDVLNRNAGDKVGGADSVLATYAYEAAGIPVINDLVRRIAGSDFDVDFRSCAGPLACEENPDITEDIAALRAAIDVVLEPLVSAQVDPFKGELASRYQRALLLLGDYYRSQTRYPMPKDTTSAAKIFAALFGEFAYVLHRDTTPAQSDLGTYAAPSIPDSELTSLSITVKSQSPFTASGLYALPGVPLTITRTDEGTASAWLQIQALDPAHYAPFQTIEASNFERPISVRSERVSLTKDVAVTITSPYGGPIQIGSNRHDADLTFDISNVGQHPLWKSTDDSERYLIALASDVYSWTELVTSSFVAHATLDKMRDVLNTPVYQNAPARLAEDYEAYLGNWPLWFEGYKGRSITDNPELSQHRLAYRYQPEINAVRHLNAGSSTCQDGCIGAVLQTEGDLSPLSRNAQYLVAAEMHARLPADAEYEATPQRTFGPQKAIAELSFIHSNFRRNEAIGSLAEACPELPYQDVYALLQAAHGTSDPGRAIREQERFSETVFNTVRYVQLMAALEAQGALQDGWEVWPRINLYERRYARGNRFWGVSWPKGALYPTSDGRQLGYQGYSAIEAFENSTFDDWMLIALSWVTDRDLTNYLTNIWGLEPTEFGTELVASYNYDPIDPAFYALSATAHCSDLSAPALPLDGVTTWP